MRVATDVLTAVTHVFPARTHVFPADTSSKRTARYISSYCPGYESSMTGSFLEVIVERAGETLPEEAGIVDTWERH